MVELFNNFLDKVSKISNFLTHYDINKPLPFDSKLHYSNFS